MSVSYSLPQCVGDASKTDPLPWCRFGTKRVRANQVYQEYIQDKYHVHMNSTRWVTLTEFIKHLGRSGIARVDDTEKGVVHRVGGQQPQGAGKSRACPHLSSLFCVAHY